MDIIFERAIKATAAAVNRERVLRWTAGAIDKIECVLTAVAQVVFRERAMKLITVIAALLVITIALPSLY